MNFYPSDNDFTQALLGMLVTDIIAALRVSETEGKEKVVMWAVGHATMFVEWSICAKLCLKSTFRIFDPRV